jgi:RimJ/RimL family protein N-acetyltransferase
MSQAEGVVRLPPELRTCRLILRQWQKSDREPFALCNGDHEVMEYFPARLSVSESNAFADRAAQGLTDRGWGLWAAEVVDTGCFAGFVGLNPAGFPARFTPAVEIGWRLGRAFWGQGLATEAARAVLDHGFEQLQLGEIVSFTSARNLRSQRVMQKLAMSHDAVDDFDHPNLPPGHELRRHVLYRLTAATWNEVRSLGALH